MWDGALAPTDRLLIWPEQGVGDTIQMVRFLREARMRVGSITLACQPGTRTLLESVAGVDDVIDVTDEPAFERFDRWLPTIRLPVVFNADPARPTTPTSQAYLFPDAQRTARFAARFAGDTRVRVGLVWAGSPDHAWDDLRSCPLAELETLRHVAGVAWYALQKGAASADEPRHGLTLAPLGAELVDYADTAAVLTALDLLITVDTSVAHLAGALGKPAWVMLSNRPDWRWQLTGSTSPWYPTLRLFRQGADGTWPPVVAAIAAELTSLVAAHRQRSG